MSELCPVEPCTRPRHQNHMVCAHHAQQLERDLGDVPALLDELETTLARQTSTGGRTGGRGAEKPLPFDLGASDALAVLRGTLEAWCREIGTRGAAALLDSLDCLLVHPCAGDAVDEIGSACRNALRAIDRARPGLVYAGRCGSGECQAHLYARPDHNDVRCRACGAEHLVLSRRADMVDALDAMALSGAEIAKLAAYFDLGIERQRARGLIKVWASRGLIADQGTNVRGEPTYRFGEVLARLRTTPKRNTA